VVQKRRRALFELGFYASLEKLMVSDHDEVDTIYQTILHKQTSKAKKHRNEMKPVKSPGLFVLLVYQTILHGSHKQS